MLLLLSKYPYCMSFRIVSTALYCCVWAGHKLGIFLALASTQSLTSSNVHTCHYERGQPRAVGGVEFGNRLISQVTYSKRMNDHTRWEIFFSHPSNFHGIIWPNVPHWRPGERTFIAAASCFRQCVATVRSECLRTFPQVILSFNGSLLDKTNKKQSRPLWRLIRSTCLGRPL